MSPLEQRIAEMKAELIRVVAKAEEDMTHAPTQLDASRWEEMARAINGQMDLWIQTEKQRGTWEANAPTVGQAYYASLVVAAFAQVAAEAREQLKMQIIYEAACCSGPHPFNGNPGIVGNWLDALKSPSHLLPKK